jgi:DNA primase
MNKLNDQYKIVDYLTAKGIKPVGEKAGELLYYSPLKNERTPSFYVNPTKNRFNDFSTGEKGDIFRLVQKTEQTDFKGALELLSNQNLIKPFSFSGYTQTSNSKVKLLNVIPITKEILKQYIAKRGIDLDLARKYVSEVHYSTNGRNWYALGFKNDSGGYELRNALNFKTKTISDITTIKTGTNRLSIFEGFFDFLSALQYYGLDKPHRETIVLNSLTNIPKAIDRICLYSHTSAFLDNDKAGLEGFARLEATGAHLVNQSGILYPQHKDFNAYLCTLKGHKNGHTGANLACLEGQTKVFSGYKPG